MKKNITQLTIKSLYPLLLGCLLFTLLIIGLNFRSLVLTSMEEHVISIADITKAGLTAHMKSGQMKNRGYFLQEIAAAPHIKSIKIIRSDAVSQEYGDALSVETAPDKELLTILQLKKPYITINEWDKTATLRGVIPYIATSEGNLNCLHCHHVPENTVLGAVDIELDITEYRDGAWMYLLMIFGILSLFFAAIMFSTSHVIEKFVRTPLLELIQYAKSVFYRTDFQRDDLFQSKEFTEVASEFMKFGEELKEREARIEQTMTKFQSLNNEIDTTMKETLFAMGEAEEKRSSETHNHTRRVVEYSRLLGKLVGLEEHEIEILTTAAPLHDIGKIGIPDSILLKPGRLNEQERLMIEMHATMGYDILKHSEREVLQAAATIAHQHHERWDGLGYPARLKEKEIHIFAQIVAIADVFDALGTKRVYKDAWPLEKVREYFQQESGKAFDPHLIDLMVQNYPQFETLYQMHYQEESL